MTNTSMKSKEVAPPTSIRRASLPASYKNKTSVHPQWMRTLEEKYQKLHLKITRNASIMNNIKNLGSSRVYLESTPNTISRGVYNKVRADRVIQKYRNDYGFGKNLPNQDQDGSNLISKYSLNGTIEPESVTIIRKDSLEDNDNNDDNNNGSVSKSSVLTGDENDNIIRKESNSKEDLNKKVSRNYDVTTDNSSFNKGLRKNSLKDNTRKSEDRDKARPQAPIPRARLNKNVQMVQSVNAHNKLYKKDFMIKREQACKTSTSRYSNNTQKTTKSCPATMEKTTYTESSRLMPRQCISACAHSPRRSPTKRRLKSFMGMSMEAQHAMTETIKAVEPEIAREKDNSLPGDFDHTKECSNEGDIDECKECQEDENLNWNYTNYNDELKNDTYAGEVYSDSELSFSTRTRPHTSKTQRMRLPEILPDQRPYESLSNLHRLEHFRYRIPGIGNYDIPFLKEQTFEITPPGFDIRYKDIPVYEEYESETPPPDIKDRAVQKCQEWLSRFTPR